MGVGSGGGGGSVGGVGGAVALVAGVAVVTVVTFVTVVDSVVGANSVGVVVAVDGCLLSSFYCCWIFFFVLASRPLYCKHS